MGCDSSKTSASKAPLELIWICGYPSAGKTWLGDYLATRGFHHIDGDMGNQTKEEVLKGKFDKLGTAMQAATAGEPINESDWHPYYQHLCDTLNEACKNHKKVVLSFAPLGAFGNEKDFIDARVKGVSYIKVEVDEKPLMERFYARDVVMQEKIGMNHEQIWNLDNPMCENMRKKYGAYSPENYKQMLKDSFFALKFIDFKKTPNCYIVNNNNVKSGLAVKQLNKLVGLKDEPIDAEAIAKVNYDRMENF